MAASARGTLSVLLWLLTQRAASGVKLLVPNRPPAAQSLPANCGLLFDVQGVTGRRDAAGPVVRKPVVEPMTMTPARTMTSLFESSSLAVYLTPFNA